ncbi:MAG: WG repeat-containing protein [Phycisphaeraceae bacterium]
MINRRLVLTVVCGWAVVFASLDGRGQPTEPPPRNWVFNERGQKTDQVELVATAADDALYPISINNHWGLMNQNGQVVVYPRFDWTDYSFEGLSRYVRDGKTGYLRGDPANDDDPNEFFIIASFDYADRFVDGTAVVMKDGRWGMIDLSGRYLVGLELDGMLRMQDGFAAIEKDGLCGFVDRAGKLRIPPRYQRVRSFHDGFAAVQFVDGRWGYIDQRGKVVWEDRSGRVTELGDFHEGYARIRGRSGDKLLWGYISQAFRFRVDPAYEDARDFHHGMAAVKFRGKWGFINAAGRWAVDPVYDEVDDFDDAVHSNDFDVNAARRPGSDLQTASVYAAVKRDGRWGYINLGGRPSLVPQFEWADPFFRGLARVERDGSFAYLTETGKVRFDPRVMIRLGLVDLTGREDGRVAVAQGSVATGPAQIGDLSRNQPADLGIANQVYGVPEPREPASVPYVAEHLYRETLPALDR